MKRKQFIQTVVPLLAAAPLTASIMNLKSLNKLINPQSNNTNKMPVLFLGHGSPMNAIEENEFVKGFRKVGQEIQKPQAILIISAHWETRGTFVTAMDHPRTIHDFGGFPPELFAVQYPAPGSPELAKQTQSLITSTNVGLDENWGLDHGAWSVIKHLYPNADIPIIQMSLDYQQGPQYHYELAKEIKSLRNKGVLIVGSGNMVHNLGMVEWRRLNETFGYDWALETNEKMKSFILNSDHQSLINYQKQGKPFQLAIPSPEHYLPLLYTLGIKEENESVQFFNDKAVAGSLTMTSVKFG
jgi:4,5-DOPA dioxygenase extradiol